ncbi:MAG: serine/threonine-protein kinase [Candidatus Rokuibacteriota bacterium]
MIQKIGKYRVLERIGRGGMGTVFKAHDPVLDRSVALKVISPDIEVTDALRTRFFREAQACARLNHPNIVTVYDLAEVDGHLFIVMELLEGEELKGIISQRKPISLEDKLAIMMQVCDGLAYAHQRGVVHRDVKPGNIFVLRDGSVKIVDFGIARIANSDSDLDSQGTRDGDPALHGAGAGPGPGRSAVRRVLGRRRLLRAPRLPPGLPGR